MSTTSEDSTASTADGTGPSTGDDARDASPAAEPVSLVDLTDEELAVLAGPDSIVVTPHLSTLPPEHRDVATGTAYRGLVARGILGAPSPQEVRDAERQAVLDDTRTPQYPVTLPENLSHLLTLRSGAPDVVCVALSSALTQAFAYAHVVEDVALLEEVTATGLHRFSLLDAGALADTVCGWVLHPEATAGSGEDITVDADEAAAGAGSREGGDDPTPPDALLERLGAALLRADVIVRRVGDEAPELLSVFSGPKGTWTTTSRRGTGEALVFRPASPDDVRALVAAQVTP